MLKVWNACGRSGSRAGRGRMMLQMCVGSLLLWLPAEAQAPAGAPVAWTAEQITGRLEQMNARRAQALHGYSSRREMTLRYKGILTNRQANQVVEMTFTAPGSKTFAVLSSSGSPLLRDSVFQREIDGETAAAAVEARQGAALTAANYHLKLLGEERLPVGNCFVLAVSPKTSSRFAYEGKVWVQSADFAIVRIEGRPAQNPSFWVRDGEFVSEYGKIGDFWLPRETISNSHVRFGGEATFTMQFSAYRLLNVSPMTAESSR
ncbi:MAG: hypothetical protein ACRYFU_17880 [Janthinobacterium lividum]